MDLDIQHVGSSLRT